MCCDTLDPGGGVHGRSAGCTIAMSDVSPFVWGSDPIPRDVFLGIKLLGCFPRGYFVLLGIRRILELLKQVISLCPKTYRSLRYEYKY